MKRLLLLLTLLTACLPETGSPTPAVEGGGAAGSPEVGVKAEAVCGSVGADYTVVRTNLGAAITENSYKTRAFRTYLNNGYCGAGSNLWTVSADTATSTDALNRASYRLKNCFDLPSCAGWACRQCQLQTSFNGGAWTDTGKALQYNPTGGIAKMLNWPVGDTFATMRIDISPTKVHFGN